MDLKADHGNFPEQELTTIIVADIQDRMSSIKSWTAPGPEIILIYWQKKLTALLECLVETATNGGDPPRMVNSKVDSPDYEGPPDRSDLSNYRLNNLPWHGMEGIIAAWDHQKGIGRNTIGVKRQVLTDRAITQDNKVK